MQFSAKQIYALLLSLTAVVFICQGSALIDVIHNSKWLGVLLLGFYLLITARLLVSIPLVYRLLLLGYVSWCLLTTFWSEIPLLSFLKSSALVLVVSVMISAGIEWIRLFPLRKALSWLWLVAIVAFFSSVMGGHGLGGYDRGYTSGIALYQGLTFNPNILAGFLVMSMPLLFWLTYRYRFNKLKFYTLIFFIIVMTSYLFSTYSRSCFLFLSSIIFAAAICFRLRKRILVLLLIFFIGTFVSALINSFSIENLAGKYIFKSEKFTVKQLIKSRVNTWSSSYQAAEIGGWIGAGYGVSIGDTKYAYRGLTSVGYGREKGNAQLAIVEETGVVGLILYLMLILTFFFRFIRFSKTLHGEERFLVFIVWGSMLGVMLESVFEAWWDSPASPESIFFWTLFGIACGIELKLKKQRRPIYEHTNLEKTAGSILAKST